MLLSVLLMAATFNSATLLPLPLAFPSPPPLLWKCNKIQQSRAEQAESVAKCSSTYLARNTRLLPPLPACLIPRLLFAPCLLLPPCCLCVRSNHLPFPGALRSDLHNKMLCKKETARKRERERELWQDSSQAWHIRCGACWVGRGKGVGRAASVGMNLWRNIWVWHNLS